MKKKSRLDRWTLEDSLDTYNIQNWGAGYFNISKKGEVVITLKGTKKKSCISLMEIIDGINDRGLDMPVLLRVQNILDAQITLLHECFNNAIRKAGYRNVFRGVYPIKVNQQQQVIEEVAKFGSRYHHGFEAGSKAELIAALAQMTDMESCLILNGYKDEEFADLGLYALKMGYKCFFVIESPSELPMILERAATLKIRPLIGVRAKLSSKAGGHWTESGGDRSIFGLNAAQIVEVVDQLQEKNMLDCLQLLHYHLGSQIPNIRDIRGAVLEACRMYVELVNEGAAMGYLDLGGGLAVDYDGSHTNYTNSRNYSIDEYCVDIIEAIMSTLDDRQIEHPVIITESGRAVVAYYSILLFNILDVSRVANIALPKKLPPESPEILQNFMEVLKVMNVKNLQESLNDALYYRDELRQVFKHGNISLRQRAIGETIFWHIVKNICKLTKELKHVPPELVDIDSALADTYYANFSIFQSLPDSWAIGHLFPVMPVHRLKEEPTRQAILADITCDCDGKIDKFIDLHGERTALPLHDLKEGEEYYLGAFLVGAYQETLGDLHNLFGDTNIVTIRISENGEYDLVREIHGDSVGDVLSYVEFDPKFMVVRFRKQAEKAVREGRITARERKNIMSAYEAGLRGYTYYER